MYVHYDCNCDISLREAITKLENRITTQQTMANRFASESDQLNLLIVVPTFIRQRTSKESLVMTYILQSHLWKLVELQEVLLISSEYFKKYSATDVYDNFE